jgi:hypothetical protein
LKSVAAQAEHVASALSEPAMKYWPAGQVRAIEIASAALVTVVAVLVEQDVAALVPTLKSEAVQAEHVVSALAEPAVKYWPAGQVLTVLVEQDLATLMPTLKSVTAQAEHVASALAEPAVKYWPAGQVVTVFVEQDVAALVPTLKSEAAQAEHVASVLAEPAVKYWPARQVMTVFITVPAPVKVKVQPWLTS